MPSTTKGRTPETTAEAIGQLADWLIDNLHIPIQFVHYDADGAEVSCPPGRFDALLTAADVADSLTDASIVVTDPLDDMAVRERGFVYLTVTGFTGGEDGHQPLELTVDVRVYDDARTALLSALGASPIPGVPSWHTTAFALRDVVAARGGAS